MKSFLEKFHALDPKQKKRVTFFLLMALVCIGGYWGYGKRQKEMASTVTVTEREEPRYVGFDQDLVQKTIVRDLQAKGDKASEEIRVLKEELAQLKENRNSSGPSVVPPPLHNPSKEKKSGTTTNESKEDLKLPTVDEIKNQSSATKRQPSFVPPVPSGSNAPVPAPVTKEYIGGIGALKNSSAPAIEKSEEKKKTKRTVYLPPSFMTAHLITGGDISTSGNGKSDPEPLFLRVQAPAVLPGNVRANLRSCFFVAEATGRLDKERAIVRLNSLSCIGSEDQAVIDEPVKGFVVDSDAKNGLAGRVVSRMGASLARAFIAGGLEGAGNAFSQSSQIQSVSGLTGTTTSVVDTGQLKKSAIGGALSTSAETLKDVYVDLVKQATPVIEIKADRKVTVFISEGVELEIKDLTIGGIDQ